MGEYKLDRTAFKAQTAEDAPKTQAAYYINSVAFNYPENEPPKMDKTAFSMRRRK
jgi:hypothetical protein